MADDDIAQEAMPGRERGDTNCTADHFARYYYQQWLKTLSRQSSEAMS